MFVAIDGGLNGNDLFRANILGAVLPILVMLELVVRSGFARAVLQIVSSELAGFHLLDLGDLTEQLCWGERICHTCL